MQTYSLSVQHLREDDYLHLTVHNAAGDLVAQAHIYERKNHIWVDGVVVEDEYRRQGIATAIYCYSESITGKLLKQSKECTPSSRALWAQPGRSFGKVAA